ncbi:MAG: DUF1800 family protein, partial [Chloroflexi bacterium]|nr:DUF1800 family protein [Chloroflexota bacterium]
LSSLDDVGAIASAVREHYDVSADAEWTLEANPGDLTPEHLHGLRALGFDAVFGLPFPFLDSGYNITAMLRVLFNSDFFKEARFARLKNPAEVVVGTMKLVGGYGFPSPGIGEMSRQVQYMGQDLLNPPSVEGWHTGVEWINSGSLMKRINFCADMVGDVSRPGIQSIVGRIREKGALGPEQLVDTCLDLMGPMEVIPENRQLLVDHATEFGQLRWETEQDVSNSGEKIGELLQLVVSLREYLYA